MNGAENARFPAIKTKKTPRGETYSMTTDNQFYVLLAFRGTEFGSALEEDAIFLRDEFYAQGCVCVSLLFGGEDISFYLDGLDFMYEPFKKYFCFFNKDKLREAKSKDGKIVVFYPKDYSDLACIFSTHDSDGNIRTYRVHNDKVREKKQPDDDCVTVAQFYGYVQNDGRTEYIYGVTTT
jgi:hypothetical protein